MATLEALIGAWDMGYDEYCEAFDGLNDEDLWRRPDPRLLSIGELTGHVAFHETMMTAGRAALGSGPLIDEAFEYYTSEIENPVRLAMGVQEMRSHLLRHHQAAKSILTNLDPDSDDKAPEGLVEWPDPTWGNIVKYMVFHVAYHGGQAYNARHLMGHTPPDN